MSSVPLHLYEITDTLSEIAAVMMENGGELTPEMEAELDAMEGALKAKAQNIIGLIKDLEGSAKLAKEEADRITKIRRARENTAGKLRDYLLRNLTALDMRKLQTDRGTLSVSVPRTKKLHVTVAASMLPSEYRITETVYKVDTDTLREALERGDAEAEKYAELVPGTPSLRIL